MLQATVMLPGTDKAGGRLVDMNYELKWTSLHNLKCVWTERGPTPESFIPNEGSSVSCAAWWLPVVTNGTPACMITFTDLALFVSLGS
jgi:hypothetical protein